MINKKIPQIEFLFFGKKYKFEFFFKKKIIHLHIKYKYKSLKTILNFAKAKNTQFKLKKPKK